MSVTVHSILFLFPVSVDTSVILIVSKYQGKKVTAKDFIAVFVRKYTFICAYIRILLPIFAYVDYDNRIIIDSCDDDCC